MQQMIWFVTCYFPALFGVIACFLTLVILLLPTPRTKNPTTVRRSLFRYGTPVALGMLVLLLLASGGLYLIQPKNFWNRTFPPISVGMPGNAFRDGMPAVSFTDPNWMNARLPDGNPAPDFTLTDLRTGAKVNFSQYRGDRPAILVFGSPGCDLFCDSAGSVRRLYEQYKDKAAFVFIHVTNAPHGLPERVERGYRKVEQEIPVREQRQARARVGVDYFDFPFPCLLDTEDKQVEKLYDAWPRRLIVIQPDGRIARDIGRGLGAGWDIRAVQDCLALQILKAAHHEARHAASKPGEAEKAVANPLLHAG